MRGRGSSWADRRRTPHPQRRQRGPARGHHAFRRQRAGWRIHDQPGQVLSQQRRQRPQAAGCRGRVRVRNFVFSSTCATYGPPDRVPMTEDLPQHPINPYGESKLMFERMLHWYHGFTGWSSSPSVISTPRRQRPIRRASSHRIPPHPERAESAAGPEAALRDFGADYPTPDGTCIRDYIHIIDLAQAHILAWRRATGLLQPRQRRRLLRPRGDPDVREGDRASIPAIEKPRRPGDPPRLVASAEKALRELGWKPKFPSSKTSSPPPGPGTASTPKDIRTERRCAGTTGQRRHPCRRGAHFGSAGRDTGAPSVPIPRYSFVSVIPAQTARNMRVSQVVHHARPILPPSRKPD